MTFLGVDIGTSSSKGVLVDASGAVVATAVRAHTVSRPRPGHVEMDPEAWWREFRGITRELLSGGARVEAVGVSGMGPCVALADAANRPLRPAVLYGVDTRAVAQIARLDSELGRQAVLDRCGSVLSTQAVGPKVAWVAEHEPEVFHAARRLFMPASYLAHRLTGAYVLDHHSASQSVPFYDTRAQDWYRPWVEAVWPHADLPELRWPGEEAGTVTAGAAAATGLAPGTPVLTGTIDAWAEAVSVDATRPGDLMLMYGTTMFLIATVARQLRVPELWSTVGAHPGTRSLAGGMATSGAVTDWLRGLFGAPDRAALLAEAADSGAGARGLVMLPYFAGERTPVADPDARGVIAGLTVEHTRGDLYRAALEATAHGVRHNIEAMRRAGAGIERVVAVGGGTQGRLWTQIVSDVTGLPQDVPTVTVGAAYGAARLAADLADPAATASWNPVRDRCVPDPAAQAAYDRLHGLYRNLYPATRDTVHALARFQREAAGEESGRAG
ncbi:MULTISPECIES: FGGY family carbohydrate kinase [unclassified Streptomyces]|uniref:FGGY-family carbohydrate kinase n=1 Tax=unclassified Streptomyces TaxID=2593676 RepID=UPI00036C708E|nr:MULTISPECIES: FGGY family carbohydrate kinase [unclassified Streptomyces]MYX33038.1 sugar kinase [Streptomyces sp. SID8377]